MRGTVSPVGGQATLVLNQEFRSRCACRSSGRRLAAPFSMTVATCNKPAEPDLFPGDAAGAHILAAKSGTTCGTKRTCPCAPTNCTNELNYFAHTIGLGVKI